MSAKFVTTLAASETLQLCELLYENMCSTTMATSCIEQDYLAASRTVQVYLAASPK